MTSDSSSDHIRSGSKQESGTEPAMVPGSSGRCQAGSTDGYTELLNADELVQGFRRHRMNKQQIERPLTHRQVRRLILLQVHYTSNITTTHSQTGMYK